MSNSSRVLVLKFGSSLLRSEADLPSAAREIVRWVSRGERVVAVVSALADATETLLARARAASAAPDPAVLSSLLATGERTAAALLTLTLGTAGATARLLDPARIGFRTKGPLLDSDPCSLDTAFLRNCLEERAVAVIPGFFGVGKTGEIALLGRGGSDLTALFLAHRLRPSRCRLLKDVHGVYESDPAGARRRNRRFTEMSYEEALSLRSRVVQRKALLFAQRHDLRFEVGAPGRDDATRIGPGL